MIRRIVGCVAGCLGFIASVIAIWTALGDAPLKVVGEMELHPTAWVLLATVFIGVCCGLTVPALFSHWWTDHRRARAARFQELLPEIRAVRAYYDQHALGGRGRPAFGVTLEHLLECDRGGCRASAPPSPGPCWRALGCSRCPKSRTVVDGDRRDIVWALALSQWCVGAEVREALLQQAPAPSGWPAAARPNSGSAPLRRGPVTWFSSTTTTPDKRYLDAPNPTHPWEGVPPGCTPR